MLIVSVIIFVFFNVNFVVIQETNARKEVIVVNIGLRHLTAVEARYDTSQICTVRSILELVFIRSGYLELNDTSNSTCISACEIDAFLPYLLGASL